MPLEHKFIYRAVRHDVMDDHGPVQPGLHLPHRTDAFNDLLTQLEVPPLAEERDVVARVLEPVYAVAGTLRVGEQHLNLAGLEVIFVLLRVQVPALRESFQ